VSDGEERESSRSPASDAKTEPIVSVNQESEQREEKEEVNPDIQIGDVIKNTGDHIVDELVTKEETGEQQTVKEVTRSEDQHSSRKSRRRRRSSDVEKGYEYVSDGEEGGESSRSPASDAKTEPIVSVNQESEQREEKEEVNPDIQIGDVIEKTGNHIVDELVTKEETGEQQTVKEDGGSEDRHSSRKSQRRRIGSDVEKGSEYVSDGEEGGESSRSPTTDEQIDSHMIASQSTADHEEKQEVEPDAKMTDVIENNGDHTVDQLVTKEETG
jgi:hypothetical protein